MKTKLLIVAASLPLFAVPAAAQTVLVPFNQPWKYMHPMGTLPADADFESTWFLKEAEFTVQYNGPAFGASPRIAGVPGTAANATFDSGIAPGPIGYDVIDYFAAAGAELTAFGKLATDANPAVGNPDSVLSTPVSGARRAAYFRTTFEVTGSDTLVKPSIRMLMDDGCFIYIDGVKVAAVNLPVTISNDGYTTVNAANATNTETQLISLDLFAAPDPAAATRVITPLMSLQPGTHTLAISARSNSQTSSDLAMGLELSARPGGAISAAVTGVSRDYKGTADILDDSFSFNVTVNQSNIPGGTWTADAAAGDGSTTGPYGLTKSYGPFPVSESPKAINFSDNGDPTITAAVLVVSPKPDVIVTSVAPAVIPFVLSNAGDQSYIRPDDGTEPGWTGGTAAALVQLQPAPYAGGNKYFGINNAKPVFVSEGVNIEALSSLTASIKLAAYTTSTTGFEADDTLTVLVQTSVTGDFSDAVNAVTLFDGAALDGVAQFAQIKVSDPGINYGGAAGQTAFPDTDFPFVKKSGGFTRNGAKYARFFITGGNNSGSEFTLLDDLTIGTAVCNLTLASAPAIGSFSNGGDDDPNNDRFAVTFTVNNDEPGRAGFRAGGSPEVHPYGAPLVLSLPYSDVPQNVVFTDSLDTACTLPVPVTTPPSAVVLSAPAVTRIENGPGVADDTYSITLEVTGTNVGLHWTADQPVTGGGGVNEGLYGAGIPAVFGPFPVDAPVTLIVSDKAHPFGSAMVSVNPPLRYAIGQKNLGAGLQEIGTALASPPSTLWVNDPALLTLTMTAGIATESLVTSEVLDLTAAGSVNFSALLTASETSAGSNFETTDKFKAVLIINGSTTVNLIDPFDRGDGATAVAGTGLNGLKDGWLNGFSGVAGTDVVTGTVYAAGIDCYNANADRDEFNRGSGDPLVYDPAVTQISYEFPLNYTIPSSANSAQLIIYGIGAAGSETLKVSNILFASAASPGDTDGDGMDDAYEDANGLAKNDPSDRDLDLDGDGQSNFQESLAGTAANNASSTLKITAVAPAAGAGSYSVTWQSAVGKNYQLEQSADLGAWADIGGVVPSGGASTSATVNVAGGGPKHYLRVKVVP